MGIDKKILFLKKTTPEEVKCNWKTVLPNIFLDGNIFIESNSKGEVDWNKNSVYSEKELKGRKIKVFETVGSYKDF